VFFNSIIYHSIDSHHRLPEHIPYALPAALCYPARLQTEHRVEDGVLECPSTRAYHPLQLKLFEVLLHVLPHVLDAVVSRLVWHVPYELYV